MSHAAPTLLRLTLLACLLTTLPAQAINKCQVGGQTVYQDTPCQSDARFVAQARADQARLVRLHQKLDELAARGQGLPTPKPATPPQAADPADGPSSLKLGPKLSRTEREAKTERWVAARNEETRAANERSATRLNTLLDGMKQECGKDMDSKVKVGMSDATFRNCTLHARFGGITQVVAADEGSTPLRLYIFDNAPNRVYAVDGVITAIKP